MAKKTKKEKKVDLAETVLENPAVLKFIDGMLVNPKIQNLIDRIFFRKTLKYGLVMACLLTGMFSVVNGVIVGLNLGWAGWIISGTVMSVIGGFYTLKQLRKDVGRPSERTAESSESD